MDTMCLVEQLLHIIEFYRFSCYRRLVAVDGVCLLYL